MGYQGVVSDGSIPVTIALVTAEPIRIPFFFEPNFNARIEPLAAALRIQADKPNPGGKEYKSVVYGEFLLNKVGNNFADGKGKY